MGAHGPLHALLPRLQTTWAGGRVALRLPTLPSRPAALAPTLPPPPAPPPSPADYVGDHVPRLLINRERAGELTDLKRAVGWTRGFNWGDGNYRCARCCGSGVARTRCWRWTQGASAAWAGKSGAAGG